jgi:hypothetical protein
MGATTFMVAKTFMSMAISVYDNFSKIKKKSLSG